MSEGLKRFSVYARIKHWPLHTFLLALFAPLSLLAHNAYQIRIQDSLRAISLSVFAASVLLAASWLIFRQLGRAGLFASFLVIIFFSYGHVYEWGRSLSPEMFSVVRHRYLVPMVLAAIALVAVLLGRLKADPKNPTAAINLAAMTLLIVPTVRVVAWWGTIQENEIRGAQISEGCSSAVEMPAQRPDIYYIILDAYARHDVLRESYQYDNSWFLEDLRGMGFYVAEASQSNYTSTGLSLASSLNYSYLSGEYDHSPPGPLLDEVSIQSNEVRKTLECLGYEVIAFDSGYSWSGWRNADYFLSPTQTGAGTLPLQGLNPFEGFLVQTSLLRVALDLKPGVLSILGIDLAASHDEHRERVLYSLDQLGGGVPGLPSPKFVFAHIVSPHRPFLFDREGNYLQVNEAFTFADGQAGADTRTERQAYTDQLHYLNTRILETLDQILAKSNGQAVIVVQGDHGTNSGRYDRMSILNAYYLPLDPDSPLYPTISPVNTFRLIFNTYFNMNLDLFEDRSYFSTYDDLKSFEYLPNPSAP